MIYGITTNSYGRKGNNYNDKLNNFFVFWFLKVKSILITRGDALPVERLPFNICNSFV